MKIDDADRQILRELQQNGRLPIVELAELVGLSASPCLRRVRQLEKRGAITGYSASVDAARLGLNIIAYIQVNLDQRSEADTDAFREAVLHEPAIIECYALTGSFDYLIKVAVADLENFADLTMQRILRFPGVNSITSGVLLKVLKEPSGIPV